MENLKEVRKVADKHNKPVLFDSFRFAENAYFIKVREKKVMKTKLLKKFAKKCFHMLMV